VDILQTFKVQDLMPRVRKVNLIPEDMRFVDFKRYFAKTKQHYFPVMDQNGRLNGIFSSTDIRGVLFSPEIEDLVVMKDIATSDIILTTPEEDLNIVLQKFTQKNIDSLPVVETTDHGILVGMLTRRNVISFYNERIQEMKGRQTTSTV
jgi:CIC family chloride channel protein